MPVSYHEPYHEYQRWVNRMKPKSLWDIGMGYGNIGAMAKVIVPEMKLYGVDVFMPYLVDVASHAKEFEAIIVADIRDLIFKLWPVDMTVAFDVIEHLPRQDGIDVIQYLKSISKMGLLVSVPIVDYPQDPIYGNEAERHLTQWKVPEMEALGATTLFTGKVCGLFEFKGTNETEFLQAK